MGTAALISLILSIVEQAPTLIAALQQIGQQSGELTAAQIAAQNAQKQAAYNSPAWQTDQQLSQKFS